MVSLKTVNISEINFIFGLLMELWSDRVSCKVSEALRMRIPKGLTLLQALLYLCTKPCAFTVKLTDLRKMYYLYSNNIIFFHIFSQVSVFIFRIFFNQIRQDRPKRKIFLLKVITIRDQLRYVIKHHANVSKTTLLDNLNFGPSKQRLCGHGSGSQMFKKGLFAVEM